MCPAARRYAIGIEKPKATPSQACGKDEEALEERVDHRDRERDEGQLDGQPVQLQHQHEGRAAAAPPPAPAPRAGHTMPAASGRSRVRSTCGSKLRSAQSLIDAAGRAHQDHAEQEDRPGRPARECRAARATAPTAPATAAAGCRSACRAASASRRRRSFARASWCELQDPRQENLGHQYRRIMQSE